MKRTALTVAFLVFLSAFTLTILVLPEARATTLYVGGGGPGNYTTIQEAIDDADRGYTIFVFSGIYQENLIVNKTISLIGENRDTTVIDGNGTGNAISVTADWVNVTGVTAMNGWNGGIQLDSVRNCSIVNNRASCVTEYGILMTYTQNSTVDGNTISGLSFGGFWGNGIALRFSDDNTVSNNILSDLGSALTLIISDNNTVKDNSIWAVGRGILSDESRGNSVVGNSIMNTTSAITIWSSSRATIVENVLDGGVSLAGNLIGHWNTHTIDSSNTVNGRPLYYWKNVTGGSIPPNAGQVILANCTGVLVENQEIDTRFAGIQLGFSSHNTIANNNLSEVIYPIFLFRSRGNTVSNNTLSGSYGVNLYYSGNSTIVDNVLTSVYGGLIAYYSSNITITGNSAAGRQDGTLHDGIMLYFCENSTVVGNTMSDFQFAFYLNGFSNSTIMGNSALRSYWGLRVFSSSDALIAGNLAVENEQGLGISFSRDCIVKYNTIARSGTLGMQLSNSERTRVFHNNFINNTVQASDSSGSAEWDNGYPSGGNYWSDYAGVDLKSGPNQDQPGSDGLGDTPYVIDPNSEDRYPLMSPATGIPVRPPRVLDATLSGDVLENVTIMWETSPDDGKGLQSVSGYRIYRGTTFDSLGLSYGLVASLSNGTTAFVDSGVGEGDANNYFYRVCAVSQNNSQECDVNQAAKFTHPLAPGPNLISIPLIQSNKSIEYVLQTVEFDKAWFYDSSSQEWKWYMKSKTYRRGLWSVNHTMGLWVNVTKDSNLTVAGVVPAQTMLHLYEGWNLVSFPSFNSSYTVADLKVETGATRVEEYDPVPPYHLRGLGDADVRQAGWGYWVRVVTDTDWIVEVS